MFMLRRWLYNAHVRKIIHLDMDAFFASVEQRDRPELRGRPVAVGGSPDGRGVVAAASYEARRYGVHSAMPSAEAKRRCPHITFVRSDHSRYRAVSQEVFEIFHSMTPLVEPLSLDEAYLDVTQNALDEPLAGKVALALKREIHERVGLTASAGVAPNKLIAKIASDMNKPDGLVIIPPDRIGSFMMELPVKKLWGVGPATERRLREAGISTCLDLRNRSDEAMGALLGQQGLSLRRMAFGIDPRPVRPERTPKSRGAETTFETNVIDTETLERVIAQLAQSVAKSLQRIDRPGRTVTLKLRYSDFTTITRGKTIREPSDDGSIFAAIATELMHEGTEAGERPVRLIGLSVGGLRDPDEPQQLWLPLSDVD